MRCVTVDHSNWDTHNGNFRVLKEQLLPNLDAALSTLFRDLADRGMLDRTLVIVTGEFGRTSCASPGDAGRDHWGPAFTVALGGGGVKGGMRRRQDRRLGAEKWPTTCTAPKTSRPRCNTCSASTPIRIFILPKGRPVKIVINGRSSRGCYNEDSPQRQRAIKELQREAIS